ncbi:hypothetical protein EC973_006911 [Apophysomyces ossiformis]|uniref:MACPF domain-containing protein n=1 Tax=Apophysomyces ossiformis TaxID=679940 RepID=A0A8H7BUV7_9FUNG|nr:hypothetical protein EC973_006911 [Apophysomyces ossiformis]
MSDTTIRDEWLRGVQADGQKAKRQAAEIVDTKKVYCYPDGVLKVWDNEKLLPESIGTPTNFGEGYAPKSLPLPGPKGFQVAFEKSCTNNLFNDQILFSPTAIRATKEFKDAVRYALNAPSDAEKFAELENVFSQFGYYYPYWITTGGDPELLHGAPDIDEWLASTATSQVFLAPLDVSPTYDLLEESQTLEIERIYTEHFCQLTHPTDFSLEVGNKNNALARFPRSHQKVAATKGFQFDGSLSSEDVVEMVKESNISKIMKTVSVKGKPRIDCKVLKSALGENINSHAFLPSGFPEETVDTSGYLKGAITHHIQMNGGELQPATQGARYFVMYVTYRELVLDKSLVKPTDDFARAVKKALQSGTSEKTYQDLQKVFGRFGYYYPTVISLGGRIMYKSYSTDQPDDMLVSNGVQAIDRALKRDAHGFKTDIEAIGGSSVITGCQDWIDSVKTSQTRIHFKSARPVYELLDEEIQTQVKMVYNMFSYRSDSFPELVGGTQIDGSTAESPAIELSKDSTFYKMVMLKQFSDEPRIDLVKRNAVISTDIGKCSSVDFETDQELPGTFGFKLGAEAGYKELKRGDKWDSAGNGSFYYAAYVKYKELYLYDEFLQATKQFKEAVDMALQIGNSNADKYFALQDVFQRFGYYYPFCTQYGARLTYEMPPGNNHEGIKAHKKNMTHFFDGVSKNNESNQISLNDVTENADNPRMGLTVENSMAVATTVGSDISRKTVYNRITNSLMDSRHWIAIGGDSAVLLWNDVDKWIRTVSTNPTVIQRKNLKPIYELLDEEQRSKVLQVYEDIVISDERIHYDYFLTMTIFPRLKSDNERENILTRVSTEEIYQKLLQRAFPDQASAMEFCRTTCNDAGFFITQEMNAKHVIYIHCARGNLPERTDGLQKVQPCKWGVMLVEDERGQWEFQKPADPEESEHNHELPVKEQENYETADTNQFLSHHVIEDTMSPVIVSLHRENRGEETDHSSGQFVRYGDIVRIRYVRRAQDSLISPHIHYITVNKEMHLAVHGCDMFDPDPAEVDPNKADVDFQWKIVRCSPYDNPCKPNTGSFSAVMSQYETSGNGNSYGGHDYVCKGDIIAFESQKTFENSEKVYLSSSILHFAFEKVDPRCDLNYEKVGWHIHPINQYQAIKRSDAFNNNEALEKRLVRCFKQLAADNQADYQYELGQVYLHGLHGVEVDTSEGIKYLEKALNQGFREAYYELGTFFWRTHDYTKAMNIFNEATYLPVIEVCRQLGDIYHNDSMPLPSGSREIIVQDRKKAFLHYSVGAILGDAKCALTVGTYLEEGLHADFGIDRNRALRWYEYVKDHYGGAIANLAIGKLKHTMANDSADPSRSETLRREAFEAFEAVALSETYARFMVAVYHLNGWAGQESDPTVGFNMLLSLLESGLDMVPLGIATCYARGVGVERDPVMAAVYRELADLLKM